jgi:F-type H+-transporting ATPase subunit alpha
LNRGARLVEILKQPQYEPLPVERQVAIIYAGTKGYLDNVALGDVRAFETELYRFIESRHPTVFRGIAEKKQLDDQLKASLDAAVKEFATDFAARKSAAA